MKLLISPFLALAGFATISQAAIYTTDFEESSGYPASGGDLNGSNGWYTVNAEPGVAFVVTTTYGAVTSNAGAIGGQFDVPTTAGTASVNRNFSSALGGLSLSVDISIVDSGTIEGVDYFKRDNFGITLTNGGANLFTLHLVPDDDSPADPAATNDDFWKLRYSIGAGPLNTLTMAIIEGGLYTLSFDFTANGSETDLFFVADGINFFERTETLDLDPSSMITDLGFSWTPSFPGDEGSNFMTFDNLVVVPEPSSALLLGIAGLAFAARRKRA